MQHGRAPICCTYHASFLPWTWIWPHLLPYPSPKD
jgi:hypothetical protein